MLIFEAKFGNEPKPLKETFLHEFSIKERDTKKTICSNSIKGFDSTSSVGTFLSRMTVTRNKEHQRFQLIKSMKLVINTNPSRPNPGQREIFIFTSLWRLRRFYEGL